MSSARRQIGITLFNNHDTAWVFNKLNGEVWKLTDVYEDQASEELGPYFCDLCDLFSSRVCIPCENEEITVVLAVKSTGNNYEAH